MVDGELLAAAERLMVVGRAGIGLDNVDLDAATARGVMVVNAPESNVVSAAEHTMALLLAQARNVPQAHAALVDGRWERSKWEGVELADKTLGIVGLGRIGKLVADRARGFGMRLVAFDPYVSAERARLGGVELMALEQVVAESDFLTIHLPKTAETAGLIGRELLLKAKPGLRIVNVARGGIVDEAALAEALRDGTVAGAALDVFATEPTTESPLFGIDSVVVTPHLGASTREAQDKAGDTIADMVLLALAGEFVPFAVNLAVAEAHDSLRPFLPLAERLGGLFGSLVGAARVPRSFGCHRRSRCVSRGRSAPTTRASSGWRCSRACSPGCPAIRSPTSTPRSGRRTTASNLREVSSTTSEDYVNLVSVGGGGHSISGTLHWRRNEQRIVMVDGHTFDVPPVDHMVMITNDDRPGVIGTVGTLLGDAGVNIADMDVGRSDTRGQAVMLIAPTSVVEPAVLDALRAAPGIVNVVALNS